MSEIVNQLKNQNLATVSPVSFNTVGGQIFPDSPALFDVLTLTQIVDGYRATNAPTYGQPIPNTFAITTTAGEVGIFPIVTTQTNRAYKLIALSVTNGGGAPISIEYLIGDGGNFTKLGDSNSISAGSTVALSQTHGVNFDNSIKLYAQVTSGTEIDAIFNVTYCEIVQ